MAGRTHVKHCRVYTGGYDLSGYSRLIGPLTTEFTAEPTAAMADTIKTAVLGHPSIMVGTLDGLLDNTASSGLHVLHSAAGGVQIVTVAIGDRAAPAAGDPIFAGSWYQKSYHAAPEIGGTLPVTMEFGEWATEAATRAYKRAWGNLLHAKGAETAVNGGTANHDHGASSAFGGFGVLHVFAGDGTATFTIEHSAVNVDGNFDSTGAIVTFATTDTTVPFAEIKPTAAVTTTVQRYIRWQVALGTATSVTFALSFVRGVA
jgi:hypothetical protein